MQTETSELKEVALRSTVLRSSKLDKVDKTRSVAAYIQSQKSYLATYVKQGQAVKASWDLPPPNAGDDGLAPRVAARVEVQSELGTLILKPRVPEEPRQKECALFKRKEPFSSKQKKDLEVQEAAAQKKGRKNSLVRTHAVKNKEKSTAASNAKQPTLNEFVARQKKKVETTASKKRRRSPGGSDDERDARLAERRERRRANRGIVRPKANEPPSNDDDDVDDSLEKRAGKRQHKKRKGVSMSAGLALMHGFSAANIGKNRLTLKPDKSIGVFNKGKASARTRVEKGSKSRKQSDTLFSEDKFLNRKTQPAGSKEAYPAEPSSDSESAASNSSSSSSEPRPKIKRTDKRTGVIKTIKKHVQDDGSGSSESEEGQEESQVASEVLLNEHEKRKDESLVWEIELGRSLDAVSEHPTVTQAPQESVIVLNTRSRQWMLPDNGGSPCQPRTTVRSHAGDSEGPTTRNLDVNVDTASGDNLERKFESSSLCPSQSASQVAGRIPAPSTGPAVSASVSRYFGFPAPMDSPVAHDLAIEEILPSQSRRTMDSPELRHGNTGTVTAVSPSSEMSELLPRAGPDLSELMPVVLDPEYRSRSTHRQRPVNVRTSLGGGSLVSLVKELQAFDCGDIILPDVPWDDPSDYDEEEDRASLDPTQGALYTRTGHQFDARLSTKVDGVAYDYPMDALDGDLSPPLLHSSDNIRTEHSDYLSEGFSCLGDYGNDENASWPMDTYDLIAASDGAELAQGYGAQIGDEEDIDMPISDVSSEVAYEYEPGFVEDTSMNLATTYDVEDTADASPRSGTTFSSGSSQGYSSDLTEGPPDGATTVALQRFSQGRALLMGLPGGDSGIRDQSVDSRRFNTMANVEHDVAKHLQGHWLPQRL